MGRRSQHTPEELRELILKATRSIVEERGFRALSAREIAREIGYAPGTLYNMYENLDEILLRVEARVLTQLDDHIGKSMAGKKQSELLRAFAEAYIDFAYDHPRLWGLVQFHHPEIKKSVPEWYLDSVYAPIMRLEPILGASMESTDPDEVARLARQLWSVIHGVTQIATTPKFGIVPKATALCMIEHGIEAFIRKHPITKALARVDQQTNGAAKKQTPGDLKPPGP